MSRAYSRRIGANPVTAAVQPVEIYMDTKSVILKLSQLRDNPARNLKDYPIDREVVARIKASMGSTGLWNNLQVRPHPTEKGAYQIASGHHRLRAALAEFGPKCEVTAQCGNYGDFDMLRMMLAENTARRHASPGEDTQAIESAIVMIHRLMDRVPELYAAKSKDAVRMRKARTADGSSTTCCSLNANDVAELKSWYADERALMDRVPELYAATTSKAIQKRKERATKDGSSTTLGRINPSDLSELRAWYTDERQYQAARKSGEVGRTILTKFFVGAISTNDVRAILTAMAAAKQIGFTPAELANDVESIDILRRDVKFIREQAAIGTAPERIRHAVTAGRATIKDRVENGKVGGRRARAVVMAEQTEDPLAIVSALLQEVPADIRAPINRLRSALAEARKLGITSLRDIRTWGNMWSVLILCLDTVATALDQHSDGLTDAQRKEMRKLAEDIVSACNRKLPGNVISINSGRVA